MMSMSYFSNLNPTKMKKFYPLVMSMAMLLCLYHASVAQEAQPSKTPVYLGKSENVLREFKQQFESSKNQNSAREGSTLELQVTGSKTLTGKVNVKKLEESTNQYLIGEIENHPSSTFYIRFNDNAIEGNIVLRESKEAYKYYTDELGNAYIIETHIDSVLCVNYEDHSGHVDHQKSENTADHQQNQSQAVPDLQSYPGANGVVLLDFDGHYVSGTPWNNGNPINAQPSGMNDAQVLEAWEIVAEDFRPFNVNITTNEAVFNSYPKNRRMRCIITPTNTAAPGAGGVAYVGSFSWNDDTPCWTFITSVKGAGEASSHEIGHTFGLYHDGRTNPSEGYYKGHGSWAPIMGVGYYKDITQWSRGEYAYANNTEDDLAKIASTTHGVGFRNDDNGNTTGTATALNVSSNGTVSASQNKGVIERTGDIDMFSFTTGGGSVQLTFSPASRHANLDILVKLYNSSGSLVSTHDPSGLTSSININLSSGDYFVSVDGTGAGNPSSTGYSDYGSLGNYTISGTIPAGSGNQSPVVSITSPSNGATFTSPASITINANASDSDGSVAKVEFFNGSTKLGEDTSAPYAFSWTNVSAGTYTLTAKATDNAGASATSAAVSVTVNPTQDVCSTPTALTATNITSSSATLTWSAQTGASNYLLWWRPSGGSWQNILPTTNSATITGLQSETVYYFTVAARCSDGYTPYASPYPTFTTKPVAANTVTTIYQHCNYSTSGYAVDLALGSYTLAQLNAKGISDNSVSSLRVQSGYEVVLYRDNNFQGGGWIMRGDYSCLTGLNFNDMTSSIVVRQTATAAASNGETATAPTEIKVDMISTIPVVAPNPFINNISVKFDSSVTENAEVEVVDTFGKQALRLESIKSGEEINLSSLSPGIYVLRIKVGDRVSTQRVMKR